MAFNPDPKVRAAADFAKEFGADRVIIWYTRDNGEYGYASYGETSRKCTEAKRVAEESFETLGQTIAEVVCDH